MAQLAIQKISRAGVTPTLGAANAGGDTFLPGADVFLHVKNASGGAITVTVATPGSVLGDIPVSDVQLSVPATTGEKLFGPFPAGQFADPADGLAHISYSGVTSLTIGAFKVSQP